MIKKNLLKMKEFRKDDERFLTCKECGKHFESRKGLSNHLRQKHGFINMKEYYDKWFKEEGENKCKVCGNETKFYNFERGYKDTCCRQCANKYRFEQIKKSFKEKYGEEIIFKVESIRKKVGDTCFEKYGHRNPAHGTNEEKVKKTMKERYGVEYYTNSQEHKDHMREVWSNFSEEKLKEIENKKEKTNMGRYGVKYVLQNEEIREKGKITKLEKYGDENYHNMEKTKQTNKEKYGVEYNFQLEEVKEKIKETKEERYGDENYNNMEKNRQTKLEKYGDENYHNMEKTKQTNLERYGVEYSLQAEEVREKGKKTCLKKFGVENASQNKDVFNKGLMTRLLRKQYKDTNLHYQASYELDFLEKYYDIIKDLEDGPSIKYKYKEKEKIYFSDFYSPFLNLIIEIKSSWTLKLDESIKEKKKYTLKKGYNYIRIVNKNYDEFNKYLNGII
jgi:uncharacterized C2H2 Zn-finger protein